MPKCDFNKMFCNFIKITLQHGCSLVNVRHVFRTPFYKNTYGGLLLKLLKVYSKSLQKYLVREILMRKTSKTQNVSY